MLNNKSIIDILNSDLINGISNLSQFYNIYQSTKAGTYAQMNHDLSLQTNEIEKKLDEQTNQIVSQIIEHVKEISLQNKKIIKLLEEVVISNAK